MGLALARLVCDEVEIRTGSGGTTVLVRMRHEAPSRGTGGIGRGVNPPRSW